MRFSIGDRVRVSDDWFVQELRGAIGTVAMPPKGVLDQRREDIYWIEFDEPWPDGNIDSAEIDAGFLNLA